MKFAYSLSTASLALLLGGAALAQPAPATQPTPEPAPATQPTTAPTTQPTTTPTTDGNSMLEESDTTSDVEAEKARTKSSFGVGARFRYVFAPQFLMKLFLDRSETGKAMVFGAEAVRRRGNLDIVFGVEYWNLRVDDGLFLDKGDDPSMPDEAPDFVRFDGAGGIGADVQFVWHSDLAPAVQIKYGAGIGVVVPIGDITQTDTMCPPNTSAEDLDNPNFCTQIPGSTTDANVPPLLPLPTLLTGVRFKPIDQLSINIELGLHLVFFGGVTIDYFF